MDLKKPTLILDDINGAFNFLRVSFEESGEYMPEWHDYTLALLKHKSVNPTLEFLSNLPFIVCIYFAYIGESDVVREYYNRGFFNRYRRDKEPRVESYLSGRYVCLDLSAEAAYKYGHDEILMFQLEYSLFNFNLKENGDDHGVSDEVGMYLLKLALQDRTSRMIHSMLPAGRGVLKYRTTRINDVINRMRTEEDQKQEMHKFLSLFTNPVCMLNLCSVLLQHLSPENRSYICYGTYMALSLHKGLPEEEKLHLTKELANKKVMITDFADCSALLKHLLAKGDREMTKLVKGSIPCDPMIYDEIKEQLELLIADNNDRNGQIHGLIIKNHFTAKAQSDIRGQAMMPTYNNS